MFSARLVSAAGPGLELRAAQETRLQFRLDNIQSTGTGRLAGDCGVFNLAQWGSGFCAVVPTPAPVT